MKRILSMILALVLLLTCVPALPAYATEPEEIHEEVFLEETEPAVTEETEPPTTEETEPPVTEETEPPTTEETEPPVTEETEPPATEETEPPMTEETEPPVTEETEPPATEETEPPVTEETELPVVEENVSDEAMLAGNITAEGLRYEIVEDATVTITGYTGGFKAKLVIPSEIGGKPVREIAPAAFKNNAMICEVVISDGIISIGDSAFYNCDSMSTITIPETVRSIGKSAFESSELMQIVIPNSVTSLGANAFYHCLELTDVVIGDGVTCIEENTFAGCAKLTDITIGSGVTSIGANVFAQCTQLTKIAIGKSVTQIKEKAFDQCSALNEVHLEDLNAWLHISFGEKANPLCANYSKKKLYVNGKLVTNLVIPDGTETIPAYAFAYCNDLQSVSIPASVTEIGKYAFSSCFQLSDVYLQDLRAWSEGGAKYSGNASGYVAKNLFLSGEPVIKLMIPDGVKIIGAGAFAHMTGLEQVEIPDSVTQIDYNAFGGCTGLETVKFGTGVEMVNSAFDGCTSVTNIYVKNISSWLKIFFGGYSHGPLAVNTNKKYLYVDNQLITKVEIPGSVTKIPRYAFAYVSNITEVVIGEGITDIGTAAFRSCTNLEQVSFPSTLAFLEHEAFKYCEKLESVHIPEGIANIYSYTFEGCKELESLTLPNSLKEIGTQAFFECSALKEIIIPDGVTLINSQAFAGCESAKFLSIGTSVEEINNGAFSACKSLTNVYIPDNVEKIWHYAFSECTNLETVAWGINLQTIAEGVFDNCTKLKCVAVPKSVKYIYEYAFENCEKLHCMVYEGTAEELQQIKVYSSGNDPIFDVGWHCEGTCCQPSITVKRDNATGMPKISWKEEYCCLAYAVYRATSSKGEYEFLDITYDYSYVDLNAAYGKKYYYIVVGISDFSVGGPPSKAKSITTSCAPPVLTASTDSSGYPYIKWSKVKGAEKYEIYYSATADGTYTKLATTSKTSYTHTKASAGKGYYYKVKTIGSSSSLNSILSEPVYAVRKLAKPALSVSVTSAGKPTITWKKISGAVEYELQVKCNDGEYQTLTTTTALTFTHEDVAVGNAYTYRARAISAVEETTSDYGSGQTVNIKCGKPVMSLSNDPVTGKPIVSWDAVEGAQQYQIYYATSKKGKFKELTTVEDITFTHTGASASKTYYYEVRALDANGVAGPYCSVKSIVCDCVAPKITSAKSDSKGYPYIKWGKVSGAKKYEVYYSTAEDGTYTKLTTTSKTSYTHEKATAGKGYYYKVRAYGSSTSSRGAFSETVFAARQISKPSVTISLNSSAKEATIKWKTVKKAIGYEVQVKVNDGEYQTLTTTEQLSFIHTGLEVGADYTYRVKAICELEAASRMSSTQTVHIKCAKSVIKVTNDPATGEPSITWDAVEGADYYQVYYATSKKGKYKKLASVSDPAYTHTKASVGKKYYYKVRAVDALGVKSSYSSVKYTVCDCARPVVTVSLNEAGQPVVKWNKVSKAKKYEVYVATAPDGTYTKLQTTTSTSYTHTKVEEGVTYYYKVRALASSSSANSAFSQPVSLPTA